LQSAGLGSAPGANSAQWHDGRDERGQGDEAQPAAYRGCGLARILTARAGRPLLVGAPTCCARVIGEPGGEKPVQLGAGVAYDPPVSNEQHFDDELAANLVYADGFPLRGLQARAAKGLAVLTCIDSRIEPLAMLGLRPGDAKILRNAGARVTDDVLRTLVLATYLLGVDRAMVIAHTDCRMATESEDDVHAAVREAGGPDTRSLAFLVTSDQKETVRADVQRVRSWPYLTRLRVGGFLYDIDTGRLSHLC
jgi:carbonic anhydrase